MNVSWLLSTTLVVGFVVYSSPSSSRADDAAPQTPSSASAEPLNPAQQVAVAILSSIQTNAEKLQGVELSLTRTLLNANVSEEETVVENLPNGGKITYKKAPKQTDVERVVLLEDHVRVDQGGTGTAPAVTYWFDGARWTESKTSTRRIAKMNRHQIGGRTLDPREVAGLDDRTCLANVLSQAALKDATVETRGSIASITTTTLGDQKLILDFDATNALLPTRSRLFHQNGAISRDVTISYAWIAERSAWALAAVAEHIYDDTVDGATSPDKWKQQLTTTVTCTLLDRAVAQQLLTPVIPAGFAVVDYTQAATFKPKKSPPIASAETGSAFRWFVIAHLALFGTVAAVILWRRQRTSLV